MVLLSSRKDSLRGHRSPCCIHVSLYNAQVVKHLRIPEAVHKRLFAILEVLRVAHRAAGVVHDFVHD